MPDISKPSQQFVALKEIKDGIVYLKGGGMRKLLMVSGVNFDLKSDDEQSVILNSFQHFLNTLDFPVQFFIHSRKTNVNAYLTLMNDRLRDETNELLKLQIKEYIEFIKSFIEENAIIDKTFFTVVPYNPTTIGASGGSILDMFFKKPQVQKAQEAATQEAREQIDHRVDEVSSGLEQIGLRAVPLGNEELIELFYNLYNPQLVEKRGLEITK